MAEPTYTALNEVERAWIADLTSQAASLGAVPTDPASIAGLFDAALAAVESGAQPPEAANDYVNIVAAVLGEHLRGACGLEWRIVEDEQGTDLCLNRPGTGWTLFPQSSVAKRWEARETGWVEPFCAWARDAAARAE